MNPNKKEVQEEIERRKNSEEVAESEKLSKTWAEDAQNELQDFIEEQGIYIRQ